MGYNVYNIAGNSRVVREFQDIATDFPANGVIVPAGAPGIAILVAPVAQGIGSVTITAAGAGFAAVPAVTITDATGVNASATAVVTAGVVTSVVMNNYGTGYTNPTIGFTGAGGSGAAASAVIGSNGYITSITVTSGGTGYGPVAAFSGGSGTGAAGTPIVGSNGTITGIDVTNGGSAYVSAPTVAITGGGGTGATATTTLSTNALVVDITMSSIAHISAGHAVWVPYAAGAIAVGNTAYLTLIPSPTGVLLSGPASSAWILC